MKHLLIILTLIIPMSLLAADDYEEKEIKIDICEGAKHTITKKIRRKKPAPVIIEKEVVKEVVVEKEVAKPYNKKHIISLTSHRSYNGFSTETVGKKTTVYVYPEDTLGVQYQYQMDIGLTPMIGVDMNKHGSLGIGLEF